jgi:hypothetical protein
MEQDYIKEQQYLKAKKRVKDIKGFYSHLVAYIIVNIFISAVFIYALSNEEGFSFGRAITHFGVFSTWLFWGIGLFFHWLGVFGFRAIGFGKQWERRKIQELMEKDHN